MFLSHFYGLSSSVITKPREMDDTMELICTLAVVDRQDGVIQNFSWGSLTVISMDEKSTPSEKPFFVCMLSNYSDTRYNLIGNIEGCFTQFLNEGRATVSLKEPSYDIFITEADPKELTEFIIYLKKLFPKDLPVPVSMPAFARPIHKIYMDCQEEYKLRMENIIRRNINLDYFTELEINNCILQLTSYQVLIAGAIRRMKNLTTLRLRCINLHSSNFLEIESKELKQLHLCHCDTPLPIASLFKNNLCYKDSLVELHLDGNQWSEIPDGIFEFRNLLKLSLIGNSIITQLPDKFTKLPKLQELELSHTQLTHLPPSIFALQNLTELLLSANLIGELPDIINLPKLETLILNNNQFSYVPSSIFAIQNLLKLSLSNNCITELPDKFTNLSKLQELSLFSNHLSHLPPSIFTLPNLSRLDLSGIFISELPDIMNLPKLETLILCSNELTQLPLSLFALPNLSKLYLSGNLISELPNIINLPKLEIMELDYNQFRYVPSSIFEMQNLSGLSLRQNHITELPDKFTNLSKLEYLIISNNQLTHLPPSIFTLHLKELDIGNNTFNFQNAPSFGSEMKLHSLKELSYRAILNHKLIVKEGMLPVKFLKDLDNHEQCLCGCKFVGEGQYISFLCNLNDILRQFNNDDMINHYNPKIPIRGKVCDSFQSCFHGRFLSVN